MAKIILTTNRLKREIPLSLIVLKSFLDQTRHESWIYDMVLEKNSPEGLSRLIREKGADFVGVSTGSITYKTDISLVQYLQRRHNIQSIFGGIFASTPGVFEGIADHIVAGRGEEQLLKLLDGFDGICSPTPTSRIDAGLVDCKDYDFPKDREGNKEFPLFTSLGCKYRCLYCSIPQLDEGRVWFKNPLVVQQEIRDLTEKGIFHIRFIDDMFGFDRGKVRQLLNLLEEDNLIKGASCQMRIDRTDEHFLDELRAAGFSGLWFGVESSSEDTLKRIGKPYSITKVRKVIDDAVSLGSYISCSFTIGYPWETESDIIRTLEFARDLKSAFAIKPNVYIVTPFYRSPLFDIVDKQKIKTWDYTRWDAYHAVMDTEHLSAGRIQEIYDNFKE